MLWEWIELEQAMVMDSKDVVVATKKTSHPSQGQAYCPTTFTGLLSMLSFNYRRRSQCM